MKKNKADQLAEKVFKFSDGSLVEIPERSPDHRYVCQSLILDEKLETVAREHTEAEKLRRDAEDAAFAERKAIEGSQPQQQTLAQRVAAIEAVIGKANGSK